MTEAFRNKILVAVDGSEQSMNAVRYVAAMLPIEHTKVVLFQVYSKVPETCYDLEAFPQFCERISVLREWEEAYTRAAEKVMDEARGILTEKGWGGETVETRLHERVAGIVRDILTESENSYSAVVVGRRGKSKLKDLVLGSVAFRLIGAVTEIPVWVVGGNPEADRILVAMDDSDRSLRSVQYLAQAVGNRPVRLTLVHVARIMDLYQESIDRIAHPDFEHQWREASEERIFPIFDEAKKLLYDAGVSPGRVDSKVITGTLSRAGGILEEATKGGYGTIVLGRRGLSRVREFLLGRVSNKVLQMAHETTVWLV
ncbi:MAG: universal stress protein [Deltaproteobacteria bacterium]|nr:universal stress protein [Deltaproteobacteria bacterium]